MAGFFQQFFKGAADGFLGSPYLKDYKHASKTFLPNGYGNAPKFKWLFHVYFDINKTLISDTNKLFPDTINHGLLVKSIDLPKFDLPLQEMNQYNRKRYIQTKINYEPVRITFHDDNSNQIRQLWHAYYSYYYADPSQPGNLNTGPQARTVIDQAATELNYRNIYSSSLQEGQRNWGYMAESGNSTASVVFGQKFAFFKAIRIYGFNQHNFALYELINPIVQNFSHDTYNYYSTQETMEHSMTIKYETVKYYEGALNGQNPSDLVQRFAEPQVYDTELSPINILGTNRSIMGQGGLVDSAQGIISDLSNGNILGAVQTAGRVSRTWKNGQQVLQTAQAELVRGAVSVASNPQTVRSIFNLPAVGSNQGTGGQTGNSTNTPLSTPPYIPEPNNNPIKTGN